MAQIFRKQCAQHIFYVNCAIQKTHVSRLCRKHASNALMHHMHFENNYRPGVAQASHLQVR